MTIINMHQNEYRVHVQHAPELILLLKRFFAAAEERNGKLKALIEKLQIENGSEGPHWLLQQLANHSEEAEVDIELV
jgi:hypothetical protein